MAEPPYSPPTDGSERALDITPRGVVARRGTLTTSFNATLNRWGEKGELEALESAGSAILRAPVAKLHT